MVTGCSLFTVGVLMFVCTCACVCMSLSLPFPSLPSFSPFLASVFSTFKTIGKQQRHPTSNTLSRHPTKFWRRPQMAIMGHLICALHPPAIITKTPPKAHARSVAQDHFCCFRVCSRKPLLNTKREQKNKRTHQQAKQRPIQSTHCTFFFHPSHH